MRALARTCGMLAALAALVPSLPAPAQTRATEEHVRSAFLFQLAQFVVWPTGSPQAQDPGISFCVLHNDSLADSMTPVVRGKTIAGREVRVLKVSRPSGLGSCHLAFLVNLNAKQLAEAVNAVKGTPVLLIGEGDDFVEHGGMVSFGTSSGRISFTVNLEATRQAGIVMRSQLLRFARLIGNGSAR